MEWEIEVLGLYTNWNQLLTFAYNPVGHAELPIFYEFITYSYSSKLLVRLASHLFELFLTCISLFGTSSVKIRKKIVIKFYLPVANSISPASRH